jgi:hypothetical protein
MSEQTRQRLASARAWCVKEGGDYIQNLVRDLKSLRSIWCYVILALYTWIACYMTLYHADTCGVAVIYATAGLAGTAFTGYVIASNSEKKMANQFPAYSAPGAVPKVGDKMGPEADNG